VLVPSLRSKRLGVSGGTTELLTSSTASIPEQRSARAGRLRAFRPDVEGLRALAVIAVVGYHAGVPGLSGGFVGVDVFLVISGYLITRHLLVEVATTGRLSLVGFYARRVRRLLPAAALVTVVTVAAGWLVLDPLRARSLTVDALYTAGYSLNWHLAAQGTDYLTATAAPSALQHYWSLAVEEQYYLVWPVLLLAVAAVTRGRRATRTGPSRARSAVVTLLLLAVAVGSFILCVRQTASSQPWAYFGLHTRAWELAVGALVAVAAPRLAHLTQVPARALTWLGLLAVATSVCAYDHDTAFPGAAAALPVLGTAAVIAGGCAAPRGGAEMLLRLSPLQVVGALSYGWYLWHWPLLQLAPDAVGHPLDLRHRILVAAVALGLAAASYALVEHPFRTLSWPVLHPSAAVASGIALAMTTAAVAALGLALAPEVTGTGTARHAVAVQHTGGRGPSADEVVARQLAAGLRTTAVPANLTPTLSAAATTLPAPQTDPGCHASFAVTRPRTTCVYGDRSARRSIVLLGDSHALQWFPALERIARTDHYRLVSMTKSSCTPFTVTTWNEALNRPYTECDAWRSRALTDVARLRPSLVVVSSLTGLRDHGMSGGGAAFDRAWSRGVTTTVHRLRHSGARVAVLDDTTNPGRSVPECLAGNLDDARACTYYRAGGIHPAARRDVQRRAAQRAGAVDVDTTRWLCAGRRCPVIVGNLLVFRDEQHLSTAYAAYLATPLGAALRDLLVRGPA
jgi:peptidoglycan/LPS O-acetylase OafA/YrhL